VALAKSIELNVRSPSFAGFCQFDPQIQFNCCLEAETGFMLFLYWCLFKIKKLKSEAVI
jgi:hypothetical protein